MKEKITILIIVAITFIAFFSALGNDFTNWDDTTHLTENYAVRSLSPQNISRIFTTTIHDTYIPLTTLSFAVEYHFVKYNPFVYHLDNVLLHLGIVVLIFVLARQMGVPLVGAAAAALLFGIHPMHVESVAWATARKDVLYGFFYVATLCLWWRYLETSNKRIYIASIVCAVLSILAKPMALSLPLIICIFDWMYGRKFSRVAVIDKIPFIALLAPIVWLTYSLNARVPVFNPIASTLTWLWTLTFYIQKFIVPDIMLPLYQLPKPVALTNLSYLLSLAVLGASVTALVWWRKNRWLVFAAAYYFASIFFLLRFDEAVDISIVADRYMYLPSVGLCLLFGVAIERLLALTRRKGIIVQYIAVGAVAVVLLLLAGKTYTQNTVWKNTFTLWDYVIAHTPENHIARNNRGITYQQEGQYDLALADFNAALSLRPNYVEPYINRGVVYKEQGRYDLALADYNKAIELNPRKSAAYLNRANLYKKSGMHDLAIDDYTVALRLKPRHADAHLNRGALYGRKQLHALAIADFTQAIEIDPAGIEPYVNRALAYANQRQFTRALADIDWAIALDARNVDAYQNQGIIYGMMGNYNRALASFNRALAIDSSYASAYFNRSLAYAKMGQIPRALDDALRARSLGFGVDPSYIQRLEAVLQGQ